MIKLIKYMALCSALIFSISCGDQLRLEERKANFDKDYFTYSRFQLTTAMVDVAKKYGWSVTDAPKGQASLYFMKTYSSDQITSFYNKTDAEWSLQNISNPYTTELRTLAAVTKLATAEGNMANVAAADVLKCVIGAYLTEKYGDIPFSEAVQGRSGNLFPKFDSQQEVYESMFEMLTNAAAVFADPNSKGLPVEQDVIFKGDKTKWLKLANSLKFRLMVHSYEAFKKAGKDLAHEMEVIASGNDYISTVEDNAGLSFSGADQNQSWYLQIKYGSGNDYSQAKPTKYLIDQMLALEDPRMYVIFAPVLSPVSDKVTAKTNSTLKINGFTYDIETWPLTEDLKPKLTAAGRDLNGETITVRYPIDAMWVGTPNPLNVDALYGGTGLGNKGFYDNRRISGYSNLISKNSDTRLKGVLMEADEMAFLLAEARHKGWITSGTVKGYYENGIKLSFQRWQIEDGTKPETYIGSDKIVDNFAAYYAKPSVALDGSEADLDKIALQKWLSMLITNQTEAYVDFRRTGKPAFVGKVAVSFAPFDYPQRYRYPLDESSNNKENYDAAVAAMGGKDLASVKMWITK